MLWSVWQMGLLVKRHPSDYSKAGKYRGVTGLKQRRTKKRVQDGPVYGKINAWINNSVRAER